MKHPPKSPTGAANSVGVNAAVQSAANQFEPKQFLASLGARPGVYVFFDGDDKPLYVGKAASLKSRVASYFRATNLSPKTRLMVAKIARAEVHPTRSEDEALLLENNLIKDKRPRYNISLRDDKSFPYIRLQNTRSEFPRFTFYRGPRKRQDRYYGPYSSVAAVRELLGQIHKIFRLRQCTDSFFRNRARPCLQYQIKRCSAPCVGYISGEAYREDLRQATAMLEGRDTRLLEQLADKMEHASSDLDFETAAAYRDRIALLQRARSEQYALAGSNDVDVVTVAARGGMACFGVTAIRRGRNLGGHFRVHKNPLELSLGGLLEAFLPQHYLGENAASCPKEILLGTPIAQPETLQNALGAQHLRKIVLKQRYRAERAKWVEAAQANTEAQLREHFNQHSQIKAQFAALAEMLGLLEVPTRIECVDISHTMGERTVGSCVVCNLEGMAKSLYRRFNISDIQRGDDYAAMRQVLRRRYQRVLQEDGSLPDLLIVDGGKGQLSVAREVLEELQIHELVELLGVSKGAARRSGEEVLHQIGKPAIAPGRGAAGLHLVQRIRDEAHRFAISGHRKLRAKARNESPLEGIEGIGAQKRRALLRTFGGLREIARAGVADLSKAPGISPKLAQRIHRHFHP